LDKTHRRRSCSASPEIISHRLPSWWRSSRWESGSSVGSLRDSRSSR